MRIRRGGAAVMRYDLDVAFMWCGTAALALSCVVEYDLVWL